jgi:hypothetical protein
MKRSPRKRRPSHRAGTFLRIPLPDDSFGYARELEDPYTAFYDYRTTEPSSDLATIESKPVLFRTAVRREASGDQWEELGRKPLEGEVARPVVMYRQNVADFRKCRIFDTAGMVKDATPEECIGLEQSAVWETSAIEERLLVAFMGRPNAEEIRSRVRLE